MPRRSGKQRPFYTVRVSTPSAPPPPTAAAAPDPDTAALSISDLVKTFEGRGEPVRAVRGLSMAAHAGRVTALLGANGAGKTTTADRRAGIQAPGQAAGWQASDVGLR